MSEGGEQLDREMGGTLKEVLARHGIDLPDEQIEALDRYRQSLWAWNEKLNLTRHTDLEKFVTRDVVDSLALEQFLDSGEEVLDIGTGGGVPGVILAIVRPDLKITLSESVGKKARAVEAIVHEVGLAIPVEHARAEQVLERKTFDTLVARAVAPLYKLVTWVEPHWDAFQQMLIIKGKGWVEERGEARHRGVMRGLELRKIYSYTTPGTDAESVILRLQLKEEE